MDDEAQSTGFVATLAGALGGGFLGRALASRLAGDVEQRAGGAAALGAREAGELAEAVFALVGMWLGMTIGCLLVLKVLSVHGAARTTFAVFVLYPALAGLLGYTGLQSGRGTSLMAYALVAPFLARLLVLPTLRRRREPDN